MKIIHLSDLHVRCFKRHKEYLEYFSNLYFSLKKQKPDIIVITGDILHQKLSLSPELIQICFTLFEELSNIAPLHIISGNHDVTLSNLSRLDALTPIVDNLKNNNEIFYYKHSGIYEYENYRFVVFSCLDKEEVWPEEKDVPKDNKINIGLYHGVVNGVSFQNGFVVDNCDYDIDYFIDIVDYFLMGDIHEYQHVHDKAVYAGSLIQQNFGEGLEKGYLIWNIENKNDFDVKFVKLPNLYPYYTINLNENLEFNKYALEGLSQKCRIRVLSRQLDIVEKKKVREKLEILWNPREIRFVDDHNPAEQKIKINNIETKIDSLLDLKVQEKFIKDFLNFYNLDSILLDRIYDINKVCDIEVKKSDNILRDVTFSLGKMKFSNIISFGEKNVFDFSKYKGLVGVFGKNGVGKSSLAVDIPLYCIYNKISKKGVVKNDLLINENKESCLTELEVFIGKDKYIISRDTSIYLKSGKKKGKPVFQGKTSVDFKLCQNQNIFDKNGTERADTDINIRQLLGTPEDFIMTSVAPQWQLLGFIENGSTDRQKLIGKYFGIDLFEKKCKFAKESQRDTKAKVKLFESINFQLEIEERQISIKEYGDNIKEKQKEIKKINRQIDKLKEEIIKIKVLNENKNSETTLNLRDFENKLQYISREETQQLNVLKNIEKKIDRFKTYKCLTKKGCALNEELVNHKQDLEKQQEDIKKIRKNKKILENEIKKYKKQQEKEAKSWVKNDKTIALKEKLNILKLKSGHINEEISNLEHNKIRLESKIEILKEQKIQFDSAKDEYEAYEYYIKAMSKDGIVKRIIYENLNLINMEINKILSSTVGFTAEIEASDNGKEIEIYFKYEKGEKRKIELCSGMEKSLVAIAIRAALVNITTLPKSNIFVLDEPVSALDSTYLDAFGKILEYLKNYFETIIIITHNDTIKDFCDYVIEIDRDEEGFAKINE
jgi:ABC-type cobalamin/Fe3+-siderophores transport system ATPase subunit